MTIQPLSLFYMNLMAFMAVIFLGSRMTVRFLQISILVPAAVYAFQYGFSTIRSRSAEVREVSGRPYSG